jgi:hypothetical protein
LLDGTQSVGPKNFSGSLKSFTFRGYSSITLGVIEPSSLGNNHYWYNNNNRFILQALTVHHTWNASFSGSSENARALIYASQNTSITINTVTFSTLYPALLSQSFIIYTRNSGSNVEITNCTFQDIGLQQVSLLYDFWNCLYNVSNTTFKNIIGVILLCCCVIMMFVD